MHQPIPIDLAHPAFFGIIIYVIKDDRIDVISVIAKLNEYSKMAKQKEILLTVEVQVDTETGHIVAAYLKIRDGKSHTVKEFAGGNAYADYNRQGELLGIELLDPCSIKVLDKISKGEPARFKAFGFSRSGHPLPNGEFAD